MRMVGKFCEMVEAGIILGSRALTESTREEPPKASLTSIWYATNRQPKSEDPPAFGTTRDRILHYGSALVRVTRRAEVPSNWTLSRLFGLAPRRTKCICLDPLPKADFFRLLGERLPGENSEKSEFLLFVHGFNVSFDAAVESIAQIAFDMRFPGQVGVFSWPSLADTSKSSYMADKETCLASIDLFEVFLQKLAVQQRISRLHIIAHSMGNFLLLYALKELIRTHSDSLKGRLGELVLIAADVESTWFLEHEFSTVAVRVTIYASKGDWALLLASEYQQHGRLGLIPPITCCNDCDTVDASVCATPFLGVGHDYYAESTRLLGDLTLVLQGHPVSRRPALELRADQDGAYWVLQAMN
jgi:esterase/lipase superfamily enzyme